MKIISIKVPVRSAVLCMGTMDSCSVVTQANEPHANLPLSSDMSLLSHTQYLSIFNIFFIGKSRVEA
jgi:hypothetical protein